MALKVIGWPGDGLGDALARELRCECAPLALHRFPDGETLARIDLPVEADDVVFAVSLARPDDKILPLLFAADAARDLGARRVVLATPYLPYMRQDARFHPGEAVSSRTFAAIVSPRFDALVTVDPHLHRWHRLGEIYAIPTRAVQAAPAIARWIAAHVDRPLVVGPDSESEQWAAEVARLAEAPHAVMDKTRLSDHDVRVWPRGRLPAGEHTPVLVDDMVSTGHTLAQAARALRAEGLGALVAVAVHALFDEGAEGLLREAGIARIATSDTVAHPTNAFSIVPELAQALRGITTP